MNINRDGKKSNHLSILAFHEQLEAISEHGISYATTPIASHLASAQQCLQFEQESFGALHQMTVGLSEQERDDTWAKIEEALGAVEIGGRFEGHCEMLVASATR